MDANADPNRDLEHIIKFIFGNAPEPFWVRNEAGFLALQKIWLMVLVKTRAYRYHWSGNSVNKLIGHQKIQIILKKPEFYDLFKMTLYIISVSNKL